MPLLLSSLFFSSSFLSLFLLFPPRAHFLPSFLPSFRFFPFTVLVGSSTCVVTYTSRGYTCFRCRARDALFPFRVTRKRFFFFFFFFFRPLYTDLQSRDRIILFSSPLVLLFLFFFPPVIRIPTDAKFQGRDSRAPSIESIISLSTRFRYFNRETYARRPQFFFFPSPSFLAVYFRSSSYQVFSRFDFS